MVIKTQQGLFLGNYKLMKSHLQCYVPLLPIDPANCGTVVL